MSEDSTQFEWYQIVSIVLGSLSGISFIGWLFRFWVAGRSYKKNNQIPGKVVLITGANAGIGKETAIELAKRGAKVYMACRSLERGNAALEEVKKLSKSDNVHLRQLDLGSMKSIRAFAQAFLQEETRLDILINNAGVMACPRYLTEDGFEMQIGTNHLGHFLLTNLLLDLIKKSEPARIINLSSFAHRFGKINKDDLMGEKKYNPADNYSQSKLANVLFSNELARRLKDTRVSVYSLHPGTINTDLFRHSVDSYGFIIGSVVNFVKPYFFKTPIQGAQTTLTCALDPELENVSGKYFDNCRPAKMNPLAKDEELAKWLWEESEKLTKLKQEI